jgi:hypothetical protein
VAGVVRNAKGGGARGDGRSETETDEMGEDYVMVGGARRRGRGCLAEYCTGKIPDIRQLDVRRLCHMSG